MKEGSTHRDGREGWVEALSKGVPLALTVGAVLVYGLVTLAYSQFYDELGVRPSEVGLQYGQGLSGIPGVAVVVIGASVILFALFVLILVIVAVLRRVTRVIRPSGPKKGEKTLGHPPKHESVWPLWLAKPRAIWLTAVSIVGVVTLLALVTFLQRANSQADDVKRGEFVEPLRKLGIEILSFRADPARVVPLAPERDPPSILDRLSKVPRGLFYLGRSGGTVVIYDSRSQHVWQIPSSSVTVEESNCETKKSRNDVLCKRPTG